MFEDNKGVIQMPKLTERVVQNAKDMIELMDYAHAMRTTQSTTSNDVSSRSHAICNIKFRKHGK